MIWLVECSIISGVLTSHAVQMGWCNGTMDLLPSSVLSLDMAEYASKYGSKCLLCLEHLNLSPYRVLAVRSLRKYEPRVSGEAGDLFGERECGSARLGHGVSQGDRMKQALYSMYVKRHDATILPTSSCPGCTYSKSTCRNALLLWRKTRINT